MAWPGKGKSRFAVQFNAHLTQGALLSALAGAAAVPTLDGPLIIDLADIIYSTTADPEQLFAEAAGLGAIVPYFMADDPCYSFLRLEPDGTVIEAAEKRAPWFIFAQTNKDRQARAKIMQCVRHRHIKDEKTVGIGKLYQATNVSGKTIRLDVECLRCCGTMRSVREQKIHKRHRRVVGRIMGDD